MIDSEAHLILLREELRKKNSINFDTLKLNTHIDDDEKMMKLLLLYLKERITEFNYNTNFKRNHDIKKCLNYIKYNPRKIEVSSESYLKIARSLRDLSEIIDYKLTNKGKLINMNYVDDNFHLLTSFKNDVEEYIHHLDREGYNVYDTNSTYMFMRDNIIGQMDYDYIRRLIYDYPSIVNLGKKDEPELIDIVASSFINSFKGDSYDETLYYQKVLLLFLDSPVLSRELQKTEAILCRGLDSINKSDTDIKTKQGEVILLNEINNHIHQAKKAIDEEEKQRHNLRLKYRLDCDYNAEEKDEVDNININYGNFIDDRDKYVITIDSPETSRYEDALFYRINDDDSIDICVYTPDISDFVGENSAIAKRAETTALNYFLPDNIIHAYFSFDMGGDRFAIAHQIHLDAQYNVQDVEVYRARINVKRNLYYADIKKDIKEKNPYFMNLYTAALNIENKHNNKKIVNSKEAYNKMKTSGNFNVGSDIIRNICLQLNSALSQKYTLPFIIHSHNEDGRKVPATLPEYFSDVEKQQKIASIIKNTSPHATFSVYSPDNKKNYADFCSPLRKPDSLWNQRVLMASMDAESIYRYACTVERHADEINKKNNRIDYYNKDLIDAKKKKLVKENK